MRHSLGLVLAAAAAGVGDLVAAPAAAVPVVAQGGGLFFYDFPADGTFILGGACVQAGGGHFAAGHQHILVLVGVGGEMGGQHHAARIGVGGHGELDGGAAVGRPGTGGPPGKDEALRRNGRHGAGSPALLDQLARRARQAAAVGGYELQRDLGAAHGDGVLRDQVGGHAVRRGDGTQRLGTPVLGYVGVGAHVLKVSRHRRLGQMHPVRQGVVGPGPAGGAVPQHFAAVQELVPVVLAHLYQGRVVRVHLGHGQVGVLPLLVQRGNGADDDVAVGPGGLDGLQPLQIGGDEIGGVSGGTAQVVGAKTDDDALGFEHGHRFRDGIHGGGTLELLTFQRRDGPGPHADHADVVVQRGESLPGLVSVHHVPRSVGVADEQRSVHIAAPGVGSLAQHGACCGFLHSPVGGLGRRGVLGRGRLRAFGGFRRGFRLRPIGKPAQRKNHKTGRRDQKGRASGGDQQKLVPAEPARQGKGWLFHRETLLPIFNISHHTLFARPVQTKKAEK